MAEPATPPEKLIESALAAEVAVPVPVVVADPRVLVDTLVAVAERVPRAVPELTGRPALSHTHSPLPYPHCHTPHHTRCNPSSRG